MTDKEISDYWGAVWKRYGEIIHRPVPPPPPLPPEDEAFMEALRERKLPLPLEAIDGAEI